MTLTLFDKTSVLQRNLTEYCNAVNLRNMIAIFARLEMLSFLHYADNGVM